MENGHCVVQNLAVHLSVDFFVDFSINVNKHNTHLRDKGHLAFIIVKFTNYIFGRTK